MGFLSYNKYDGVFDFDELVDDEILWVGDIEEDWINRVCLLDIELVFW